MAMMISLEPLRQHLIKESKNGSPTAILFAQLALFVTFLFLHKTTFISKHDAEGIKSALSYQIIALLLPYSKHLRQRKFLHRICGGLEVNLFMNSVFLLLAVPLESFYEKSKGSLGVVLSAAVLVIVLRIIIRPQNDFGVLGFLLGAAVSIACNLYRVGYQTWVVVAICIGLLSIRFLVVQNWFQVEDDDENQESPPHPISTIFSQENNKISKSSEIIEAVFVSGFYIYWDQDLLRRTNCPGGSVIIFCIPPSLKKSVVVPSVVVLGLCSSLAIALRLYTLLITVKIKKKVREISMEQEIEIVCFQSAPGGLRKGLFSVMKDALRKRYSKQSKAVASFQKVLTKTSINSVLTIPRSFMTYLPAVERGTTTHLTVQQDAFGGMMMTFGYYTRKSGSPRPVFRSGWKKYVLDMELKVGDRIIFECLDNYDDEPRYRICAQRKINLMGQETWAGLM